MTQKLILVTTFLSAFLLFTIQPLYAKFLLPYFGGTSSVWSVSVFFYSFVLLIGYLYASLLISWRSRTARLIHSFFLVLTGALLLSVWLSGGVPPLINTVEYGVPAVSVLLTLFAGLGMPILLLASVTVLMQTLYARLTTKEPYQLYALSNAGSLLGLASYPFIFEQFFGLYWQAFAWTTGFIVCLLLIVSVWRQVEKNSVVESSAPKRIAPSVMNHKWKIIALAAIPTFLLVSITEFLSKGIASFPLLWIVPLMLYLLTYILAFSDRRSPLPIVPGPIFVLLSVLPVLAIISSMNESVILYLCGFAYLMIFFTIAGTYFHRRVYELRPGTQELGSFYVLVTFGGALGSGVVSFVLPFVLNSPIELQISLVVLTLYFIFHPATTGWLTDKLSALQVKSLQAFLVLLPALVIFTLVFSEPVVISDRNFFGTLKVVDEKNQIEGETFTFRSIVNGVTNHGLQVLDERYATVPVSYYGPGSGVAVAMDSFTARGVKPRLSVVGLGAGVMSSYCDSSLQIDYIEINPAVEDLAREYFTYLEICPEKSSVTIGDGRLVLENAVDTAQPYDLIVIDAFTDDAIPVHLLTAEAFASAYKPNLSAEGIMAIHISNRYLNLIPPVTGMAKANGFETVLISKGRESKQAHQNPTYWLIVVPDGRAESFLGYEGASIPVGEYYTWTDEKSSVLQVISLNGSVVD